MIGKPIQFDGLSSVVSAIDGEVSQGVVYQSVCEDFLHRSESLDP